ncbi:MAG: hybrid sensor histidine kinase/response regulator, partial [Cytophagales bacterium]|nr:hybrid sensor histidine kinase/response regulator [Cytophagales bacterium]
DGTLWIGTEGGLDALNLSTGTFQHFRHDPKNPNSLSEDTVFSITEDATGNLWVGTFNQGLNRLDRQKGTFRRYRVQDGLPNNTIFSVLEDTYRNIWVSTNRGISQFNPRTGRFRNFDVRDGLQANEFYLNAAFQNSRGQLFMAGINGFNVFHPDDITENTAIPPVVLTDFKIFNKSVPVGKTDGGELSLPTTITECREITIPYSSSVFSFEFAALNYLHPGKNQYQYKLEGLETDWVHSGDRRFVSYTSLDPDTYTFRVRGSNNDGVWNEAGVTLKITITPPWWKSWWAYVLDVLVAAGLLYLVFRYFLYQERLKNALDLERLESEKLHEIDNLKTRFFANISHEFRTPLTLILGPVEARLSALSALPDDHPDKRDFKLMHRSARRLLTLINQLLDLSKLEAGSLKLEPTEGNLLGFLKALVYSFSSLAESRHIGLKFHSERTALAAMFDRDKVEKVVTNLLANALKFTPESGSVTVTVSTLSTGATAVTRTGLAPAAQQQFIVITIADTGIGIPADRLGKIFDRFYQVDGSNTREHSGTGIGLALTQELVHLQGGTIHVQSEEGKGTQFTVRLPLHEVQGANQTLLAPDDLVPEPSPRPAGAPADA